MKVGWSPQVQGGDDVRAVSFFPGRDGVRLAYREVGEGRPLVLLNGISGDATPWLCYSHAERITARGYRVMMPDFRGHGRSAKPHDAAAYLLDVLVDDSFLSEPGMLDPS